MFAETKLRRLEKLADDYRRVIRSIEQMESEENIWDSEGKLSSDIIQRYQELEEERQRLHSEAMRIMNELGLEFKHRDEAHQFLLGPVFDHCELEWCD
jgi:trimethylamine:corrinoid methyltransferase-like protein